MKNTKEEMLPKSKLKTERGWTEKLLKMFLPSEPDQVKKNPHYKSGPEMKLYSLKKIKKIEKSKKFQDAKQHANARQIASRQAVETKKSKINKWIEELKISVPKHSKKSLIKMSCDHYNAMQLHRCLEGLRYSEEPASINSDEKFLNRICVNYLRHCLTDYEEHLEEIHGKVGVSTAYHALRKKIFDAISKKYDWLKDECQRQQNKDN